VSGALSKGLSGSVPNISKCVDRAYSNVTYYSTSLKANDVSSNLLKHRHLVTHPDRCVVHLVELTLDSLVEVVMLGIWW
jgi:hypothetical protein